jgi:hypothetical protein
MVYPRKSSSDLTSDPVEGPKHGIDMSNESASCAEPAPEFDLRPHSTESESFEDFSSDPDTWSTSSSLTGDSTNLSYSPGSDAPSSHENFPPNSQEKRQFLMVSRRHIQLEQLAHSLSTSKTGIKECAPRDNSIGADSKHSFSNSSSSSTYSGLRKRAGSAGGSGGRKKIGGDDNDDDEGYGENNFVQFHRGKRSGTRKLACPYFKRDPSRYSGAKYRLCQYSGFATVHRLK